MMDASLRALNRFGLGARRDERRMVGDPKAWLHAQLDGGPPSMRIPEGASPGEIGDALRELRMQNQAQNQKRNANPQSNQSQETKQEMKRDARQQIQMLGNVEMRAAIDQRVASDRPFVERLVAFWSNHLCVSIGAKQQLIAPLAGSYERDVVRRHVLGHFEEMVLASARHPAMLAYLDNFQSIGPDSLGAKAGKGQNGQKRGLNENYARELLELHTLGVEGGYTQQDVQELARILTGWTVRGIGGPGDQRDPRAQGRLNRFGPIAPGSVARPQEGTPVSFVFQEFLHEPGSKTLLNEKYKEAGVEEGERAIRTLCHHPSTARFVATKLVKHFVSDDPPAAAVDRIAKTFSSTDGDLKAVAAALVDEPEAWREDARKFRTPQDWLVAVMRALDVREVQQNPKQNPQQGPQNVLRQLRHPLWSPQSPKGFGDGLQEWADPDSLLNRGELARTISRLPAVRNADPRFLLDVVDVAEGDPLRSLLVDNSIPASDRLALAIAGPAFQWR
jgi:uncharacterized protein (DUF1800 family)